MRTKRVLLENLQIPVFKYDSVNRSTPGLLLQTSEAKAYELRFLLSY